MAFTERLELPEGQWADLKTRLAYGEVHAIRQATALGKTDIAWMDAVGRALLVKWNVRDEDGNELDVEDMDKAPPLIVDLVQMKAIALYIAWEAEHSPKGRSAKGSSEPSSTADEPTSETTKT